MAKCQCQKELTETDVCPLPSGRICSKQLCPPNSWNRMDVEEEEDVQPGEAHKAEAKALQLRIQTRRRKGIVVTADELWAWIKARKPTWTQQDWEKIFQMVRL